MLMMFANELRKLDWTYIMPLNNNDLLYLLNPNFGLGLRNIHDHNNNLFIIKDIMEHPDYQHIFACNDFFKKINEFSKILDARIERLFITKKANYLFFDVEEQNFLQEIFNKNNLQCIVTIYKRNQDGLFKEIDFEKITYADYSIIKNDLLNLGIKYVITPDRYINLKLIAENRIQEKKQVYSEKIKEQQRQQELITIREIFAKYEINDIPQSENEFKQIYKNLAKQYHPDVGGDTEKFNQLQADFEFLKNTQWYKELTMQLTKNQVNQNVQQKNQKNKKEWWFDLLFWV